GQLASHALDQGLGDGEAEPLGIGPGGGEGELVGQSHLGPGRQPGPAIDHLTYVPTEAAAGPARRSIEGRSHAAVAVATASATQGTGSMFGNRWSVPRISAGRSSTAIGTTHSKISDGPAPATAGGGSGDIQWIRWSCHPY